MQDQVTQLSVLVGSFSILSCQDRNLFGLLLKMEAWLAFRQEEVPCSQFCLEFDLALQRAWQRFFLLILLFLFCFLFSF